MPIVASLHYESGIRVEDEADIFNVLYPMGHVLDADQPQLIVKVRIEKVSRRKDGQRFKVRVRLDNDGAFARQQALHARARAQSKAGASKAAAAAAAAQAAGGGGGRGRSASLADANHAFGGAGRTTADDGAVPPQKLDHRQAPACDRPAEGRLREESTRP